MVIYNSVLEDLFDRICSDNLCSSCPLDEICAEYIKSRNTIQPFAERIIEVYNKEHPRNPFSMPVDVSESEIMMLFDSRK